MCRLTPRRAGASHSVRSESAFRKRAPKVRFGSHSRGFAGSSQVRTGCIPPPVNKASLDPGINRSTAGRAGIAAGGELEAPLEGIFRPHSYDARSLVLSSRASMWASNHACARSKS